MIEPTSSSYRGSSIVRAYAGLIALLGLIVVIGSGLLYWLNHNWLVQAEVGLGGGLVLLLGAIILRPDVIRTVLAGRPVKYASNALVMTLAFVGIVALVNFLAAKHNREYDLTENRQFTFSEQTINILRKLDQPVQVIGFFQSGDPRQDLAEDYLARSSHYTNFLTYEFHDPNVKPKLAKSYDLTNFGLVFVSGNSSFEVHNVTEEAITSGLIRVTSQQEKRVYFVTGHGEPDLMDTTPDGYSELRAALEREHYLVETINLTAAPPDLSPAVATLILAGAEHDLLEPEVTFIESWLARGGKVMILINPLDPVPGWALLKDYGFKVGNDLVADLENHLVGLAPTSPLIVQYPFHEITHGLNGLLTFFPLARSLTLLSEVEKGIQTAPILTTGPQSWAETDLKAPELEFNQEVDLSGPIHIGAVAENPQSGMRLVVFGSADFVSNKVIGEVANRDLIMNAVNWLTEEEDLISIRPKEQPNYRLFLTPMQHTLTILTTLLVIPLGIVAAGVVVWWRRR
jgi:ABC-type uncharacterized transport system involved in gliding motility auxiliary subunit